MRIWWLKNRKEEEKTKIENLERKYLEKLCPEKMGPARENEVIDI